MSPDRASPETVMARYAECINRHDFSLLVPLIHPDASFWFSSGTHNGIEAARAAFEATWRKLADETYWLEDLSWIAVGDTAASCTYAFHWRATIDGHPAQGSGRGTTILGRAPDGWRIRHEHLSPFPPIAHPSVQKVCPVVVRGSGRDQEILVFHHPQAGVQLVKGTLEPGEDPVTGALRELAEESGLTGRAAAVLGTSDEIVDGQLWHFVKATVPPPPDRFDFFTRDDGGHLFSFFWWRVRDDPGTDWHIDFIRALAFVRSHLSD
jgi:ketosteroid isomerase-like protein/ADP-ribose pyrophosphatase YjhB (NUDIX family)